MRSPDAEQPCLFSYSQTADFVPADHPLRRIRSLVDAALESMQGTLTVSYSHTGRPGIAPERLIRALLLQVLYSIRSERQLVEQMRYNMLYRWFVGLSLDDAIWDATTFTKNRQRFIDSDMTARLLEAVVDQARQRRLLSDQHFCVDGTLIDAWASMGSYRRKDDDDEPPTGPPNFKGDKRRSHTHECKTDPDARLYKKAPGQASRLCYIGHVLTDNRHALVVDSQTTVASGTAEVDAALTMLDRRPGTRRLTVAADKNYDQKRFVAGARAANVTPHVAQHTRGRGSAIDARTTRHAGYAQSRNARHRVETPFGWGKFNRPLKQTMLRGLARVGAQATLVFTSYNLVRIAALEAA
jgi:transposase